MTETTLKVDRSNESAETLAMAAQGVLEAGERIALDWLELVQLDWIDRAHSLARRLAFAVLGVATLVLAWLLASAALVLVLARWLDLDASLGAVAVGEAGAGVVLIWLGRRARVRA